MGDDQVLAAALELAACGCSVLPVRADGSKAPAVRSWKQHAKTAADDGQIRAWHEAGKLVGVGVVCGAVSGQLEMLELEGRAADRMSELRELADASGLGDLWRKLLGSWLERSPSGGWHLHYRVDGDVAGNTKLARGADGLVLAETRGEGGYVVAAPTPGVCHPSGNPWRRMVGGPAQVETISVDQRDAVHALVRLLDDTPEADEPAEADGFFAGEERAASSSSLGGVSPGDDYEARTDWAEILGAAGWTLVHTQGRVRYWRRPGKRTGISATTGRAEDRERLYVFSTSTEFDSERPYTKFGAHAVLEHGGDFSAAASALRRKGYGTPPPPPPEQPRPTGVDVSGDDAADEADGETPATYSRTDDGNALRLVDVCGDTIRYVPERGAWLSWNGHRWSVDAAGVVYEHARAVARALPASDDKQDRELKRHRDWSLSARGLRAMVSVASTDPRVVVHAAELDAQPYELNTPSGVVNLRTGELRDPDPDALHTRVTAVAPDFDTEPVRWLKFLADTFAGDADTSSYVQRLLGVSLIGCVLEQILPFAFGEGANGKTTLLGVTQRLVGLGDDGYAITAPAEMLLATKNNAHPTEIARLSGARIVVTSELDDGQRFAEARVKQLTGRDVIAGRFMRQDWFSFTPTHTLWLLGNHQPQVRTGGPAFWRRIRLVPFLHTVPPEDRVADLEDQLVDGEGPAILAWLVRGAVDYLAHGAPIPDAVRAATASYEHDQDTVARFVEDRCEVRPAGTQGYSVPVAKLRAEYEAWCHSESEQPVTAKSLTLALRSRFDVQPGRTKAGRFYDGVRLVDNVVDEAGQASWWTADD